MQAIQTQLKTAQTCLRLKANSLKKYSSIRKAGKYLKIKYQFFKIIKLSNSVSSTFHFNFRKVQKNMSKLSKIKAELFRSGLCKNLSVLIRVKYPSKTVGKILVNLDKKFYVSSIEKSLYNCVLEGEKDTKGLPLLRRVYPNKNLRKYNAWT